MKPIKFSFRVLSLLLVLCSMAMVVVYVYVRTYICQCINKFGSYVRTAPFATVRKLECGTPTTSVSFVKKNYAPTLLQLVTYTYFVSYILTLQCVITFTLGFVYRMCSDLLFWFCFLVFRAKFFTRSCSVRTYVITYSRFRPLLLLGWKIKMCS